MGDLNIPRINWERDGLMDSYETDTEVGHYLATRTACDVSQLFRDGEKIFNDASAGSHQRALAFAERDHASRIEDAIPKDKFGAHITDGVPGTIGDREIGSGHVVLSEDRYQWLLKPAGVQPSWMPPLQGVR